MKVKNLKRKVFKKRGFKQFQPVLIQADINHYNYLDSLLETSNLPQKEYDYYYNLFKCKLSEGEAEELIEYLKNNQRDPINSCYYSQTDIKHKLKQIK